MVRTRSFDEKRVLSGAMHAFRRQGFGGVAIKPLEEATGLSSGSIYNAYGDKGGLYRAAFNHYLDAVIRHRLQTYAGENAGLDGLENLFLSMLSPGGDSDGCLLTNAAVEFGSQASVASDGINEGFALLESGIRRVIEHEIADGDADVIVSRLLLLYQGILVLIRAGQDVSHCADVVRDEFEQLRERQS